MATYLVIDVAGFIASKVAEFLLSDGHTVIGVDNMNDAYDVRLKQWLLEQLEVKPGFDFQQLDIRYWPALKQLWEAKEKAFDAVINLAARAGMRYSVETPWVCFETNTTGTLNLLELSREFEVKKFVLPSSSSLYGNNPALLWREDANTNRPISLDAASRTAAESLCYTYHYLYGN